MTTSQKLWLGFGMLTALLVLSCVAIIVRVRSIEGRVGEMAKARDLSAAARQLEVNTLGYALNVRTHLLMDEPRARQAAADDAEDVERHLQEYQQLATSDSQRQMAARFAASWEEMKKLGGALLETDGDQLRPDDSKRLYTLRTGLEKLLDDEIQAEAAANYNAHRDAAFDDVRAIVSFALILLGSGAAVALVTSGTVGRAVLRGERAIADQRERLRTTLASIGDAVITTDIGGRVTNLNAVAESLTGWTSSEAAGQPLEAVFRIVNEETRQPVVNPATKALAEGAIVGLANHTVLIAKDGTERAIDDSAAPIRCKEGEVVGCVLVFRDITERRRADRELRESEARKTAMFETTLDSIISINHEGTITEFNAAAERTFGHRREDVLGRELAEVIIPPAYRERHRQGLARYLVTGEGPVINQRLELSALRADGGEFPVELTVTRIPVDGPPIFTAYLRDISEHKRSEMDLTEQAKLLRLGAEVGTALTVGGNLQEVLQRCTESMVRNLDAAFARIWILNDKQDMLELRASAGLYTHLDGPHGRVPVGQFKIGLIAQEKKPHLTNAVVGDPRVPEQEWAKREGMVSFAGYPLLVEGRVIGVMAIFARHPLSDITLESMASVASEIALGVEHKHAEATLRESAGKLRFIMESAPQKIFTATPDGSVDYFNPQWTEFTGLSFDEIKGWGWKQFIHPDDVAETARVWQHSIDTGEPFSFEHRFRRADGKYRWHFSRALPQFDKAGQIMMWTGSNTDIHEQKQTAIELRKLAADLSEADRRKNEFLAMLAHELRNPLAPIRNALRIVRLTQSGDGRVTGGEQEASDGDPRATPIEVMERQIAQLVRLVDDLLDVSRISRGTIDLRRERVKLSTVIDQAVETCRPAVESAKHELTVSLPSEPVYLTADPVRLAQVFSNLLNNACKYTEPGGRISIAAERQGSDVVVAVKDTGVGIPSGMLPHVFEMFTQVDRSLERSQGGLGIGLTLVQRLVEMHNGSVSAQSEGVGRGSEFVVRLPIIFETPKPSPDEPTTSEPARVTSRRILVVDDNRDSAMSLAMLLKLTGNETQTAYDGFEAVEAAARFLPEVVLLDIGLPKLNGYEAARKIREHAWGKSMVLVALTGWGQEEDRRKSKDAGFDAHLVKPVDHAELKRLLADLLKTPV